MEVLKLCLIIILCIVKFTDSANILYAIPYSAKSHYIMLRPIGLELAKRGHNVTVITAHKEVKHPPNYHQLMVGNKEIWEVIGKERPNVFTMVELSTEEFYDKILWNGGLAYTEGALNSSDVQNFLKADHKFDLVISEQFFHEAMYALAHKYKAPLVLVTTFGNCMKHNIVTKNPLQLATVLSEYLEVQEPTSFLGRLRNFYFTIYEYVWWKYWYLENQEKLVKKYIPNMPEPVPSLYEMQRNVPLLLVNSHFSFDSPVAYGPSIVEIGGIHLTRSEASLPKDLQEILDGAKYGVVYMNFGSNVRSTELPEEKKNAFLKVFSQLKQTVIWKWEEAIMINKPDNLVIRNWLPQKEIFNHPNVKLFIAHGGLIGTQEALFHGIPIIGIPIYCDQYNNLLQVEELGFGKILAYDNINEQNLKRTIEEVLNNGSYINKAKEMSARFKDRPITAMDTAMFWIEYVIRNNGAGYMRNSGLKLNWIQNNMLDVYAFVVTILVFVIYLLNILVKLIFKQTKESSKRNKRKDK